ncbi:MAG: GTP-binding protein [Candidatus Micrarchaeota archaeon]
MGVTDKIAEIEKEIEKTQKHKGTEHHLGLLKAKIAKLREQLETIGKSGGKKKAFEVKKSGNATVVFIGFPSVGKSTLLSALTNKKSKAAAYSFTTTTVIPGMMAYKGAQIQLLDLPGIISGASKGLGRGREVLAVARNADLILLITDVKQTNTEKLRQELKEINIRLDEKPPNIVIEPKDKGGVEVNYSIKPTKLKTETVRGVLGEYSIFNATVNIRQDASIDELIDVIMNNRKYVPSLTAVNKIDLAKPRELKKLPKNVMLVSAEKKEGINELKEAIFNKLELIRIYTKSKFEKTDLNAPLLMRSDATIKNLCDLIHRDLRSLFKFAEVWGPSAKHPGQKVGLNHKLKDGDVIQIHKI